MARVGLLATVIAMGVLGAGSARADEPDHAETLFRAGNRAFAEGDYQTAYTQYREAWSLRKSFDIVCNLGRTEAELGLSRDAAEHLDHCLRTYSVSSRTEVKDAYRRFRELFERERAKVGALDVVTQPSGAEVAVDGIAQGTAPLGRSLFVEPGRRRIRTRLFGYQDQERVVDVTAGGSESLRFELVKGSASPSAAVVAVPVAASKLDPAQPPDSTAPARTEPPAGSGGMEPRTIVVLSGAALTFVGLGIGVGFMLNANAAGNRASELEQALKASGSTCGGADTGDACRELDSSLDRQDQSRKIANAAYLGSAIASAATLCLWLVLPEFKSRSGTGMRVLPGVSASGAFSLAVSGDY